MNTHLTKGAGLFLLVLTIAPLNSPGALAPVNAESKTQPARPVYEQRLFSPSSHSVAPEVAAETLRRFRAAYPQLGSPRFLIYVNRDLIDQRTGLKLAGREETMVNTRREAAREMVSSDNEGEPTPATTTTTSSIATGAPAGSGVATEIKGRDVQGSEVQVPRAAISSNEKKVATVNRYERTEREDDSFEYRQLARDLEITFGRRLRSAGASLADQKIATALIADRPLRDFTTPTEGEQARKDREALAKVADAVIEILIVHRDTTVTRLSGNTTRSKPEIHVTAIRLNDSRILGQATSADVFGPPAILQNHTAQSIADAVALYLMDDMLLGLNPN